MSTSTKTILAAAPATEATPLRFVTAASLFDGHDAAINIMRRLIQAQGVEVVHLGHNRSVEDVVRAALQEDADGIALSSYQGGHVEYFKYMVDMLKERGAAHIRVFGGGGGTITPEPQMVGVQSLQDVLVYRAAATYRAGQTYTFVVDMVPDYVFQGTQTGRFCIYEQKFNNRSAWDALKSSSAPIPSQSTRARSKSPNSSRARARARSGATPCWISCSAIISM